MGLRYHEEIYSGGSSGSLLLYADTSSGRGSTCREASSSTFTTRSTAANRTDTLCSTVGAGRRATGRTSGHSVQPFTSTSASSDKALAPTELVVNLSSGFTHRAVNATTPNAAGISLLRTPRLTSYHHSMMGLQFGAAAACDAPNPPRKQGYLLKATSLPIHPFTYVLTFSGFIPVRPPRSVAYFTFSCLGLLLTSSRYLQTLLTCSTVFILFDRAGDTKFPSARNSPQDRKRIG